MLCYFVLELQSLNTPNNSIFGCLRKRGRPSPRTSPLSLFQKRNLNKGKIKLFQKFNIMRKIIGQKIFK